MPLVRSLTAAVLGCVLAACSSASAPGSAPEFSSEEPAGSGNWTSVAAEPEWTTRPPAREGWLRFATMRQSDLLSIAAHVPDPVAQERAAMAVRGALTPVAGAPDAGRAAEAARSGLVLALRASRKDVGPRPAVPGNTTITVWSLWEVPVDDVAAAVAADKRDAARAALLAIPAR